MVKPTSAPEVRERIDSADTERLNTLYARYLKALQKDLSLVYLGDVM